MNQKPTNRRRLLVSAALAISLATCVTALWWHNRPQVFDVADYGASPAREDNRQPIQAAIEAARRSGQPSVVRFEPDAIYRVGFPDGKAMQGKFAIELKEASHVTLDGRGATLQITNPEIGGICADDSHNIVIKNFKIDYDPLPYALGCIHAVNLKENWYELRVDDGFLEPDQPCFERAMSKWGLTVRDTADGGRQYGPAALFASRWEKTGDRIWRFYARDNGFDAKLETARLKPGERYIHMARNYAQAVAAIRCDNILWENITVYSSPGLAFFPHMTAHHAIRDCHVKVKEGCIFSTNADGIHMRGSRGHALIDGCSFEGMADDGINIHSSAMSVLEQPAANRVRVKKHTYSVRPGDRVEAVRTASAAILGQATIQAVEDAGANWLLTLDRDFKGLAETGSSEKNAHGDPITTTVFYNLSEASTPVTIRNCTFNDFRGRGVLISARGATIENNSFHVREGWGVVMNYESSRWAEGPIAQHVVIRNNHFVKKAESGQSAILFVIHARDRAKVEGNPFRKFQIVNNRFDGWKSPVSLNNAEDTTIENNIENPNP